MHSRIAKEGSFILDGRTFRWAYDESNMLEVWSWRSGRLCTSEVRVHHLDIAARNMALTLM
jgi:hypothetical protein